MPVLPPGTLVPVSDSDHGINVLLKGPRQAQQAMIEILDKYASDRHRGLIVPDSLARLDGETHEFLTTGPAKNEERAPVKSSRQQSSEEEEEKVFLHAMLDYERDAKDKYKTGIKVDEMHTMAQVWQALDEIAEKYEKGDNKQSIWGRVRLAFRKLGEHGTAFEGWLGLLPTESYYLSTICGGIKLILHVAVRMKVIRDAVLGELHKIPLLLSGTQRVLSIYKTSQKLQAQSKALYTATLKALGHMLRYIRQKAVPNGLRAIFMQSSFELALTKSIDSIQKYRDEFNVEATICGAQMAKNIEDMSRGINDAAEDIQKQIVITQKFMIFAHTEQMRTQTLIEDEVKVLEEWAKASTKIGERLNKQEILLQKNTDILNRILEVMKSNPNLPDEGYASARQLDAPSQPPVIYLLDGPKTHKRIGRVMPPGDLPRIILSRLDYDKYQAQIDVANNYRLAETFSLEDQERCIHVINSPQLAAWVKAPTSTALVVNGNSSKIQRRSPWSFIAAKLVFALDQMREKVTENKDRIAAVHFFCGEHTDPDDKRNTPCSIINSLLGQLLSSFKHIDLTNVIELGDFKSTNMDAVCTRFECALRQLPAVSLVFCIIDGLPFYLTDRRTSKQAHRLIRWLIELTHRLRDSGEYTFKLLLTAPLQFRASKLNNDEMLNLPTKLPKTGGFTDVKWELGVGSRVEELA